ncbi:coiled-coil domain-containing protein 190 isoform X2 [Antechinus flavipes]|uniref:coiled-coil domain-containing protein 190 isoform X2 n=1 Tax=Antechinus flavipes TaxID=38775 RepID=UPI002235488D|nr:coiled-coil domain-containing protein 190 isoform X2 [Antechinus flavipes]
MRRHLLGRDLSRQWETERKAAKRAEARLALGLLWLEECRLYRVNTVAKEQRQLQKELEKLRQENSKKKFSSFSGVLLGTQKKPEIPIIPQKRGQRHTTAEAGVIRREAPLLQIKEYEASKPTDLPSSYPIDCIKNKEAFFQSSRAPSSIGGEPKAPRSSSVTFINPPQDQPQGISADLQKPGAFSRVQGVPGAPQGEGEVIEIMEVNPDGGVGPKPGRHTENQRYNPGGEMPTFEGKTYTFYSYLRTVDTMPTYLELFAKVKNARYLRHRVRPESERVISIAEIFGHKTCLQPGVGNKSDKGLSI